MLRDKKVLGRVLFKSTKGWNVMDFFESRSLLYRWAFSEQVLGTEITVSIELVNFSDSNSDRSWSAEFNPMAIYIFWAS